MPEAVDGHEQGRGKSGEAIGSGRSGGRDSGYGARAGSSAKDKPVDDSRRGVAPADVPGDEREAISTGGHDEARMGRVAGWRDAARRTAKRLTGDRNAPTSHHGGHDQDRWQEASRAHDGGTYLEEAPQRPRGRPYSRSLQMHVDWPRASAFGSGLALGALIGAGIALLTAPESGSRTRRKIVDAGRRAGGRAADAWDGLGDELRVVRAKTRRDVKRGLRGSRRDVAAALSDLDQRALDGLRSLRELRRSGAKGHGRDGRD